MSYVSRVLNPGERVIYATTLHWLIYRFSVAWFVLAAVLWFSGDRNLAQIAVLPLGAGVIELARKWIKRRTHEFAVTSSRVILKTGLVWRWTLELPLNKVEGMQVNQSIVGRIFGYGTLLVGGTGGTLSPFPFVSSPLVFRNKIFEHM